MTRFKQNRPQLNTGLDATRFKEYNTPGYQLLGEELVSVRQVPPNRRSVTGLFPSRKTGRMQPFESALERDFATILEFSETVASYDSQPLKLQYRSRSGRPATGYPDFLVSFHSSESPMLCDVKYRDEIFRRWADLKPRLKAARKYALERGWRYRIKTEVEIRTPYLHNARFLLPYARCTPDPGHEELLLDHLRDMEATTPQALLAACYRRQLNQVQLIPTLWSLVGRRIVLVDLDCPLTMTSDIWWPY